MSVSTVSINLTLPYTQVTSDELHQSIIQEWQEAFTTENFQHLVCTPCGRRMPLAQITLVSLTDIDLSLLSNDGLPRKVLPTSYNFTAYSEAILNPKGLVDEWQLNNLCMCKACKCELVGKCRMPQLSLANWLYYGYNELPSTVHHMFEALMFMERLLLGHARSSRISY